MGGRKGGTRREPALDAGASSTAADDERPRASRSSSGRRRKRGGRGGAPLRRLFYWSLVLALWAGIAAVGSLVFVASTLPPI